MRVTIVVLAAALAACTAREQPRADTTAFTLPPSIPDTSNVPASHPVADDTGPPDSPQWLSLMADRKRRGVDFFGVGQEPGWMIEIDEGKRLYLLANYMEDTVDVVAPPPVINPATPGARLYRVESKGHTLVVMIEPKACSDAMSGKRYPETVVINLDGKGNSGCGRKIE